MKSFLTEFKAFITKGNVLDLAVAVVIGTAFTGIVNSLVKDVIMPVISLATGQEGFHNYKYVITEANPDLGIAENAIYYGTFIQNILDFFIIAFVVFLVVTFINHTRTLYNRLEDNLSDNKGKVENTLVDIKNLLRENLKDQG
ncbi:MAG: large conductance mechanosensitive channel protein MscL [Candidatus Izemoplasma sp.]|nr:large conductance mechanosensitive channel protein MscL [Candidatus Izemoplasma sp.]